MARWLTTANVPMVDNDGRHTLIGAGMDSKHYGIASVGVETHL